MVIGSSRVREPAQAGATTLLTQRYLFPFGGEVAHECRSTRGAPFQQAMKGLRRSIATPREAKAMHSFGARVVRHEVAPFEYGGGKAAVRRVSEPVPHPDVRRRQRRGAKLGVTPKERRTIRQTGLGEDWHGERE